MSSYMRGRRVAIIILISVIVFIVLAIAMDMVGVENSHKGGGGVEGQPSWPVTSSRPNSRYGGSDRLTAIRIISNLSIVRMLTNKTGAEIVLVLPYGVSVKEAPHTVVQKRIGWCVSYRLLRPVFVYNISYRVAGYNTIDEYTGWVKQFTACVPTVSRDPVKNAVYFFAATCLPYLPEDAPSRLRSIVAKAFEKVDEFLAGMGHNVSEHRFCYIDSKYIHVEAITSRGDVYTIAIDKHTWSIEYSMGSLKEIPKP